MSQPYHPLTPYVHSRETKSECFHIRIFYNCPILSVISCTPATVWRCAGHHRHHGPSFCARTIPTSLLSLFVYPGERRNSQTRSGPFDLTLISFEFPTSLTPHGLLSRGNIKERRTIPADETNLSAFLLNFSNLTSHSECASVCVCVSTKWIVEEEKRGGFKAKLQGDWMNFKEGGC